MWLNKTLSCQSILVIAVTTVISGCMVGPNFRPPIPPQTDSYTHRPLPAKTVSTPIHGTAGRSQYFINGKDVPEEWWALFHSPQINALIVAGIENSPNLAAADEALHVAEENVNAQIGNSLFPAVDGSFTFQRQKFNTSTFGNDRVVNIFNTFNASVTVSYTLDLFGGARRQIEALMSQADYEHYQLDAAYLSLTTNIVTTSITIASLEKQIQATNELIKIEADQLAILEKQFNLGGISAANVLTQQTQLAQTQATLPPLQQQLDEQEHALAVLTGMLPSEFPHLSIDLDTLNLPIEIPVSLPSQLVEQRPDIQASQSLLHEACAQIGVATANMLPQITLNGYYGWSATSFSKLFNPATNIWSIGGQVLQPIFHGGALHAQRRGAIAAYNQAIAQYHEVVLQAFQNVADVLRALQNDAETFRAQRNAELSAYNNLIMNEQQFKLGGVSYLSLLTAQQQYQAAYLNRIRAQTARYVDTAALFAALGGDWWNGEQPPETNITNLIVS